MDDQDKINALYEAWQEEGTTVVNVVCVECQRGRGTRTIGTVRFSTAGPLYSPDGEAAFWAREPDAARQWLESVKRHPVHGDMKWPSPLVYLIVELDSATPDDTPVFARCKKHRERSLTFGQLKEALAKRSTTPAWLPV